MNKISVVILTMWMVPWVKKTLAQLSEMECVNDIVFIDNTDKYTKPLDIPKVTHIIEGKNTFINPAWNKAVKLTDQSVDKLLILNDDVYFDWDLLEQVIPLLTPENGCLGNHKSNFYYNGDKNLKIHNIDAMCPTYANILLMNKSRWYPIPEEAKIWAGDDYQFYLNKKYGYQNKVFTGFPVHGNVSLTTETLKEGNSKYAAILDKDMEVLRGWRKEIF